MRRGSGGWANTTSALVTIDDFVAQHPKLASLLPNAGTAAVVAMLLKDPRVVVGVGTGAIVVGSYLLANYGYNKIMKLAGVV